jgi:hypothetical protein
MDDRGELDLCFTLALTFYPLPQERKWQLADFGCADERPTNPVARIYLETANDSPSPSVFASLRRDYKFEPRRSSA